MDYVDWQEASDAMRSFEEPPPPALSEHDLETILIIARNGQSGRITEFEIKQLVAAYKKLHHETEK